MRIIFASLVVIARCGIDGKACAAACGMADGDR